MEIELNPQSDAPLYQQIRDRIVEAIAAQALKPGQGLPTVRALAGSFGINPNTVAKAYELLKAEGFIVTSRGGTAVADPMAAHGALDENTYLENWRARLFTLIAEARAHAVPAADIEQAVALTLSALGGPHAARPSVVASEGTGA